MGALSIWAAGLAITFGVIIAQMVMPFAFDFISTLGVFGAGVFVGSKSAKP
ncbi:hypothetical protein [Cypionkella sinensis]|uniref:Uncharacterized protein n=1 Tax=Cypionkella sinensis TaxID=1756043 RepID=A0ABV7IXG6_9RHOB